jgi:hypothetical protein
MLPAIITSNVRRLLDITPVMIYIPAFVPMYFFRYKYHPNPAPRPRSCWMLERLEK